MSDLSMSDDTTLPLDAGFAGFPWHPEIDTSDSFAASPVVSVLVGKAKVKYSVHQSLLVESSPFFAACLGAGMREALNNEVELPEDHPTAFDLFISWVYRREVPPIEADDANHGSVQICPMMRAWLLAEKFGMPFWQNRIIDELASWWEYDYMYPDTVSWVIDNVHKPSLLFKMVMDGFTWDLSKGTEYKEDCCAGHVASQMRELLASGKFPVKVLWNALARKFDRPPLENPCKYHVRDGSAD